MKEQLATIRSEALAAFAQAGSSAELDALRVKYLGKKGELTAVLKQMGKLSAEERPAMGQLANEVRAALEAELEAKGRELEAKALEARLEAEALDVTVPGKPVTMGHRHPMYIALDELKDIFIGMGFTVLDGPEVELAELNFDRLNAGEGHPSRDWSDTFYFDEGSRVMLRSQTSPMQVRAMDSMPLPIRIIAPGRVYRKDEVDATHSPMFHLVEHGGVGGRHPLPHVPPGGGHGHRQGRHHGRSEGHPQHRGGAALRQGHQDPLPPPPLPLHRAVLRDGRAVPQVRRRGLPHLQG